MELKTNWKDTPNHLPWPPILYLGAALAAWLLHKQIPMPWPTGGARAAMLMAGVFLIACGVTLELATALTFKKHKTTIMPNRAASNLVTTGPFKFTRNPIYVAKTMLLTGAGLVFGIAWFVIGAILAAVLTHHLAVKREEMHLAATFGAAWEDYAGRTARWVFRID